MAKAMLERLSSGKIGLNKSWLEQVPLGILPKSENKHEDMISILDHLYKYVPTLTSTETIANLHTSAQVSAITNGFHYVLFG